MKISEMIRGSYSIIIVQNVIFHDCQPLVPDLKLRKPPAIIF